MPNSAAVRFSSLAATGIVAALQQQPPTPNSTACRTDARARRNPAQKPADRSTAQAQCK